MAIPRELRDHTASEKAGASGDENSHDDGPFDSAVKMVRMAFSRMSARTAGVGGALLRSCAVT
jgi:hypothetical protein